MKAISEQSRKKIIRLLENYQSILDVKSVKDANEKRFITQQIKYLKKNEKVQINRRIYNR